MRALVNRRKLLDVNGIAVFTCGRLWTSPVANDAHSSCCASYFDATTPCTISGSI